jgi:hypothetical protein
VENVRNRLFQGREVVERCAARRRTKLLIRRLDQTLAKPPLMLAEEHAPKLGEPVGAILERPQDPLAVGDREGDDRPLGVSSLLAVGSPTRVLRSRTS